MYRARNKALGQCQCRAVMDHWVDKDKVTVQNLIHETPHNGIFTACSVKLDHYRKVALYIADDSVVF